MGGFKIQHRARSVLVCTLVGTLVFSPTFVHAADQLGAQQKAERDSSQGADLSKLMSLLAMVMGGMSILDGMQALQKCAQSNGTDPGAGEGAKAAAVKAAVDGAAVKAGGTIKHRPAEYEKRFPDGASLDREKIRKALPLLQWIAPADAEANACMEGAMALIQGALQMLSGLMGMKGAKKAGENAGVAGQNAGNLSSISNTSLPGNKGGSAAGIKIDPSLLRTGKANMVLGEFEKKFGIPREDFANAVFNGVDPRDILAKAPKNAIPPDTMNKAFAGAASASEATQAAAKAELAGLQKEVVDKFGEGYEIPAGAGRSITAAKKKTELEPFDPNLLGQPPKEETSLGDAQLSPEVQAALNAEEQAARRSGRTDMTIFQLVHSKYREKYLMIYGTTAGMKPSFSGVADPEGNKVE